MSADHFPKPPAPPELPRKVRPHMWQVGGVALLLIIPVLAVAGVFGERWAGEQVSTAALSISVRYPSVLRYKTTGSLLARVSNASSASLDTVRLALDAGYATAFSQVQATPGFTDAFATELIQLRPGETRVVTVELQAEKYWRHSGELRVWAGVDTARVTLRTFIYP